MRGPDLRVSKQRTRSGFLGALDRSQSLAAQGKLGPRLRGGDKRGNSADSQRPGGPPLRETHSVTRNGGECSAIRSHGHLAQHVTTVPVSPSHHSPASWQDTTGRKKPPPPASRGQRDSYPPRRTGMTVPSRSEGVRYLPHALLPPLAAGNGIPAQGRDDEERVPAKSGASGSGDAFNPKPHSPLAKRLEVATHRRSAPRQSQIDK